MPRGLVDFLQVLAGHPTLKGVEPGEMARAVYMHDKYVLPDDIMQILGRGPDATLKASRPEDVSQAVRVASGEVSAAALGLPARQFHYLRTTLGMERGREFSVDWQRNVDPYDDELLPMQGGFLMDVSALSTIEVREDLGVVRAGVGALWKDVQAAATAKGFDLDLFPIVPMDFAIGDLVGGAAPFGSRSGRLEAAVRNIEVVLPDGRMASLGYDGVPPNASGYDLVALYLRGGQHLALPHTFALTLAPAGKIRRVLAYTYPDASAMVGVLTKLAKARLALARVLIHDQVAWAMSHRGEALGVVLEVAFRAPEAVAPALEKALDGLAAGHTGKAEALSPLDAPSEFRRASQNLRTAGILGEVLCTPATVAEVFEKLLELGPAMGIFGAVQGAGISLVPFSRRPLSRRERFDLVVKIKEEIVGLARLAGPQLLLLLDGGEAIRQGFNLVRRIKDKVDLPSTINPSRALLVPQVAPPPSQPRG